MELNKKMKTKTRYQKYYEKHKRQVNARCRRYYDKNKEQINERCKKWYLKNKKTVSQKAKEYWEKNRKKLLLKNKIWKNQNSQKNQLYQQKYMIKYRQYHKKELSRKDTVYMRRRNKEDKNFRLLGNLRHRIYQVLKGKNKSKSTIQLIGCSIKKLKQYLQKQFKNGMTWENYGKYGWHVDHIRPCCTFDLSKVSEQKKCFHYKNLQPLWAGENLSKGKKKWKK